MTLPLPATFEDAGSFGSEHRPLVAREGLGADAASLLELVASTNWAEQHHAYGEASEVPAQLAAIIAGDKATRDTAWNNLYGNVWHQHTVYEATVPFVGVLAALVSWRGYPDRVRAVAFLGDIVGGYGSAKPAVDEALAQVVPELIDGWRQEPEDVQRALLWLLAFGPEVWRSTYEDLIAATLPDEHRVAWDLILAQAWDQNDETYDRYFEFENWASAGAYPEV